MLSQVSSCFRPCFSLHKVYVLAERDRSQISTILLRRNVDSNSQLQLRQVPLVHVVVPHELVGPGELLLTIWPSAVKGLLAWKEKEREKC